MSIWQEGLPVQIRTDYDIRSTMEFIGKEGTIMAMPSVGDKVRLQEGYVKIQFVGGIRGRHWWWIPISDLEEPHLLNPKWEV